jgi:hypothetical protein
MRPVHASGPNMSRRSIMATLSVKVSIAPLGTPEFSFTTKQLNAWGVVRLNVGQGGASASSTSIDDGCAYSVCSPICL